MDSKAIRTIVIFGVMAIFALTLLMMFTLDQVADTQTPQIALDISKEFARTLAEQPPANVKLTMNRDGRGVDARRIYKLRIRPNAAVAADERAVTRLMYHAAELCAAQVGEGAGDVVIRCVAELPGGAEKETEFVRDKTGGAMGTGAIHAVVSAPAKAAAPEAARPAAAGAAKR